MHSFATASTLAVITAAASQSTLTGPAAHTKAQMQACVDKIDFSHPYAMVSVDNCATQAKKLIHFTKKHQSLQALAEVDDKLEDAIAEGDEVADDSEQVKPEPTVVVVDGDDVDPTSDDQVVVIEVPDQEDVPIVVPDVPDVPDDEPIVVPDDEPVVVPDEEPIVVPDDEPVVVPDDEPVVVPDDEPIVVPDDDNIVDDPCASAPEAISNKFGLNISIGALADPSSQDAVAALEIDFQLKTSTEDTPIPDGAYIWMYASLAAKGDIGDQETTGCRVQYRQESASEELTIDQMKALATVDTWIGTKGFKDSDEGVYCKAFADFNLDENQKTVTAVGEIDEDGWEVNQLETLGFVQLYSAGDAEEFVGLASCAVASSRTDTAPGHDYKVGDKLKITSGYKVRESETAKTSLFAHDSTEPLEIKLESAGAASALASAALSALAAASILAF